MPIYFFTEAKYSNFSNFSLHPITLDGRTWASVEHFYQAMKFADPDLQETMALAPSGVKLKKLARRHNNAVRADWDFLKTLVMYRAVSRKFDSHPYLMKLLLSTGDEELIEDNPRDFFWGSGADGTGLNMLGRILMMVRTENSSVTTEAPSPSS